MRNVLFVISGPSGVGKGTLVRELLKEEKSLALSVSCTTRPPRKGERDGVDYFFVTREEFERRKALGDFLECDEHFGNFYGTPSSYVRSRLAENSVILEIDVVGGLSVKKTFPEAVLIMIVPPSEKALEERLAHRGAETAAQISDRRARVQYELAQQKYYDHVVVNDDLEVAKQELLAIVKQEQSKNRGDRNDQ